jgi:hypothetical protein
MRVANESRANLGSTRGESAARLLYLTENSRVRMLCRENETSGSNRCAATAESVPPCFSRHACRRDGRPHMRARPIRGAMMIPTMHFC